MPISADSLTPEQRQVLFEQFLKCLDREENLIHYRMSWGLQWNIACFTALFAVLFVSKNAAFPLVIAPYVQIIVAVVGASVSLISLTGIRAAHAQTSFLMKNLTKRLGIVNEDWDQTEFIRPYGDPASVHRSARRVSAFLPLLFVLLWCIVFLYAYRELVAA